jgi:hypothetical protein
MLPAQQRTIVLCVRQRGAQQRTIVLCVRQRAEFLEPRIPQLLRMIRDTCARASCMLLHS